MIADVITRLEAKVPTLVNRIDGAAQLADLMRRNALPQQTPAAHVLPGGLLGGQAEASTGVFSQMYKQSVGVLLTVRSNDRTGEKALAGIDTLIFEVIDAIAGWAPADEIGVFELTRGQLVNMSAGTLVYQIDFTINDQLRILS